MSDETYPGISIHGNKFTFEIAPVLLAAERFYPGDATVKLGGIANLFGLEGIPNFSEPGIADVATHAETQGLRYSVENPDLRILMTVAEGLYRLVGKRSAGIETVADLKGKRIATIPNTSSGYFLHRLLASAGLSEADVTIERILPLSSMPEALASGRVDAVTIWEPEMENAARVIGDDAVEIGDKAIYRELFNLNTTRQNLEDADKRRKIVRFVAAVVEAGRALSTDPRLAYPLLQEAGGHSPETSAAVWHHHAYVTRPLDDLLDVMEIEEGWLASQDERRRRDRAELAGLIDYSVFAEATELLG